MGKKEKKKDKKKKEKDDSDSDKDSGSDKDDDADDSRRGSKAAEGDDLNFTDEVIKESIARVRRAHPGGGGQGQADGHQGHSLRLRGVLRGEPEEPEAVPD